MFNLKATYVVFVVSMLFFFVQINGWIIIDIIRECFYKSILFWIRHIFGLDLLLFDFIYKLNLFISSTIKEVNSSWNHFSFLLLNTFVKQEKQTYEILLLENFRFNHDCNCLSCLICRLGIDREKCSTGSQTQWRFRILNTWAMLNSCRRPPPPSPPRLRRRSDFIIDTVNTNTIVIMSIIGISNSIVRPLNFILGRARSHNNEHSRQWLIAYFRKRLASHRRRLRDTRPILSTCVVWSDWNSLRRRRNSPSCIKTCHRCDTKPRPPLPTILLIYARLLPRPRQLSRPVLRRTLLSSCACHPLDSTGS